MADITYAQLQARVGQKLQLIADSESLDANYAALIQSGLLSVQAQISRLNIVNLDVERGIDNAYADCVAEIAAAHLVDDFQLMEPRRTELMQRGRLALPGRSPAERALRDLVEGPTNKLRVTDPGITVV